MEQKAKCRRILLKAAMMGLFLFLATGSSTLKKKNNNNHPVQALRVRINVFNTQTHQNGRNKEEKEGDVTAIQSLHVNVRRIPIYGFMNPSVFFSDFVFK